MDDSTWAIVSSLDKEAWNLLERLLAKLLSRGGTINAATSLLAYGLILYTKEVES